MGNNFICSPFNTKKITSCFLLTSDSDHSIVKEMKEVMLQLTSTMVKTVIW